MMKKIIRIWVLLGVLFLVPCFSFSGVIDSKGDFYELVDDYWVYYAIRISGGSGSLIHVWPLGDDSEIYSPRVYLSPKDDILVLYGQTSDYGWVLKKLNAVVAGEFEWSKIWQAEEMKVYFDKQGNVYVEGSQLQFGDWPCLYLGKLNRKTGKPIWEGCVDIRK